jgi:hypothetical protein
LKKKKKKKLKKYKYNGDISHDRQAQGKPYINALFVLA